MIVGNTEGLRARQILVDCLESSILKPSRTTLRTNQPHTLPMPEQSASETGVGTPKRAPRGTYRNRTESNRAWRARNREKLRMKLRLWKYSRLKYQAKRRGLTFALSREEITEITSAACHYCGGPLPNYGYGLDRKDNTQGYTRDNVVPCCMICNWIKSNQFSYQEMLELGETVRRIRARRQPGLSAEKPVGPATEACSGCLGVIRSVMSPKRLLSR